LGDCLLHEQELASVEFKNYLTAAREFFEKNSQSMLIENHYQHNLEPNFWKFMIEPVLSKPSKFEGELGFEYGCGAGRNLLNLLVAGPFTRVDGIDISKSNARNSARFIGENLGSGRTIVTQGNGYSCHPFPSNSYMFAVSHQVFIHIPNRKIRKSILLDLVRILKPGGSAVIHFKTMSSAVRYEENYDRFPKNVTVSPTDTNLLLEDFLSAGFSEVKIEACSNYVDDKPEFYVVAKK
jgi:SAM-dependent methyltransferase